ncbi:hypothetical protein SO180_41120, partial [Bradyrhizobium sp. UFLA05-112]
MDSAATNPGRCGAALIAFQTIGARTTIYPIVPAQALDKGSDSIDPIGDDRGEVDGSQEVSGKF